MKKKTFFSFLLLLALSFFLLTCGPQPPDQEKESTNTKTDALVNHTLLSDLALRAVLRSPDGKTCELASRLSDAAHAESNMIIRSNPSFEGICCCPCDPTDTTAASVASARIRVTTFASALPENSSMQGGNDCPCPTLYAWAIEARKSYKASVSIDDLPMEVTEHGDWQTFTLGSKTTLEPGPYDIIITADFLGEGAERTYTLPIVVRENGKPYLHKTKTP